MALVSFPPHLCNSGLLSLSLPYISVASSPQFSSSQTSFKACALSYSNSPISSQPLTRSSLSSRRRGSALVPFDAKSSEPGKEDRQALETVLKLYTAVKNKNLNELSEIIEDECRCICNFFTFFQSFQGKMQVLDFFSHLIKSLGDNVEFVVKPTFFDGMKVGISWKLEWKNIRVPLGKGFSFYILQTYQGKIYIRDIEMFMEPLVHIEPLRLKLMTYVMAVVDKMGLFKESKRKTRRIIFILLALLLIGALLFLFKPALHSP